MMFDYENICGVETRYSSESGYEILAANAPLRACLAALHECWPIKVPIAILRRPENIGLPEAAFTAI